MKKAAILLLSLGILMLGGAVFSFAWSIFHAINANESYRAGIPASGTFSSPYFSVDTSKHVQVALVFDVQSNSVQEEYADGGNKWLARYNFPISYRVLDEQGNELYSQACQAAWDSCGTRSKSNEQVDSRGGTVTVEHGFDKFTVKKPGRIKVEITIEEDSSYAAVARSVDLLVYDQVISHAVSISTGVLLLLFAPLLLIVGLIMLVVPGPSNSNLPVTEIDPAVRTWAMLSHLAALLGYVGIPFGHIFGPLIIWLTKKDEDTFISVHARESLNFQISITIYMMLSFILMFVLIGFVLIFVIMVLHITLSIVAALRANDGQFYRYPFTFRFV